MEMYLERTGAGQTVFTGISFYQILRPGFI